MGLTEQKRASLQRTARYLAQDKRHEFRIGMFGKADPFQLFVQQPILHIRKPLGEDSEQISGFISKMNGLVVVCTNSSKSLGHERFAAAHELYHYFYDLHDGKKQWNHLSHAERFILQDEEMEFLADQFAVHFLMPEEAVHHYVDLYVAKGTAPTQPEHVILLQHQFGVSYDSMALRLLECGFIENTDYERLRYFGQDIDLLRKIAHQEGITETLFDAANVLEMPQKYFHYLRRNYLSHYISYKKVQDVLGLLGKAPEDFGYERVALCDGGGDQREELLETEQEIFDDLMSE